MERFMRAAIKQAQKAALQDEVPVGAIIVKDGKIISKAHNKKEEKNNATSHAEIEAITKASKKLGNWYLDGCELYVTLEPCAMCAGAIINSRISKLYFGAWDTKYGCCGSLYNLPQDKRFNHNVAITGGLLQQECAALLSSFFKTKRKISTAEDKKC